MKYNITEEQLLSTFEAVVAEHGENTVYQFPDGATECKYVHVDSQGEDAPGCVWGHILNKLGIPLKVVDIYEGQGICFTLGSLTRLPVMPGSRHNNDRLGFALRSSQGLQDDGGTWGEALAEFKRVLAEGL